MTRRSILMAMATTLLAPRWGWAARQAALIVPFPPGGTTDQIARLIAGALAEPAGSTYVVRNKPGAGGTIGIADVARAAPDGSVLGVVYDSHAVDHLVYPNLPYDTFRSFEFVSLVVTAPHVLVTSAVKPYRVLSDLVQAGKAAPDRVSYGAIGEGSSTTLNSALFAQRAGFKALRVPYNGGGGAFLTDLLAGRVDYILAALPAALPHIRGGQLRALAYGGPARSPLLPDVPTLSESLPGMESASWVGVIAPAGVPKPTVDQLSDAIRKTVQGEPVRDRLIAEGFIPQGSTSSEFLQRVRADSEAQALLFRHAGR